MTRRLLLQLATTAVFTCAGTTLAQTATDDCASAPLVHAGDFSIDTTGASNDGTGTCGLSAASPDVWVDFVPLTSGFCTITMCDPDTTYDTVVSVFDGSCSGSEIVCDDDTGGDCGLASTVSLNVVAGQHYLVRVSGFAGSQGTGVLHISESAGPPANDNCSSATVVGEGDFPFNTAGATDDGTASCDVDSHFDVWYDYTATRSGRALVDTNGATFGVVLTAFDSCGGAELDCAAFDRITFTAVAGGHYLIRVAGAGSVAGTGTLHIDNVLPPDNDHCEQATVAVEGNNPFTTVAADSDGISSCGFFGDNGTQDVWYRFHANRAGLLTITSCPGTLDTIISVFDSCGGAEVACNDQSSSDFFSGACARVFITAVSGTDYFIRVATHGTQEGGGDLNISISDFPASCLARPAGSIAEEELCGDDANGGCDALGSPVQTIPATSVIYGSAFADNGLRDTDWYQITLDTRSLVSISMQSEFAGELRVFADCSFNDLVAVQTTGCGEAVTDSATLNAGTYFVTANNLDFAGSPCVLAGQSHYVMSVTTVPVGACCSSSGACSVTTQADCTSSGGTWSGAGTDCGTVIYTNALSNNAFIDISGTGADSGIHCDDCTSTATIGFDFSFFGVTYSECNISSNGNIQFAPSDNPAFFNDQSPIPTATGPNNMICPAWDDFNSTATGTIYTQTDGTAPNRRFIVSWQGVPQFADTDSNTFQLILYETSNNIEFRYAEFTARGDAADVTTGVENLDGSGGLSMDSLELIGSGNTAQLVTGTATASPCSNNPCAGADFNHADGINADDLGDFITCYFQAVVNPSACPQADFNHADGINADDLGDFITTYFSCV